MNFFHHRANALRGHPLLSKAANEFLGTFVLIGTVCHCASATAGAGDMAPVAIGLVLAAVIYSGAHVSGSHYNPAVSYMFWLKGDLTAYEYAAYSCAQYLAGFAAAGVVASQLSASDTIGYPAVGASSTANEALSAEIMYTFVLCYVIVSTATVKATQGNPFYGFAIGLTVTACAYSVGGISGGAFNPAVGLGPVIVAGKSAKNIWVYFAGPYVGAWCALFAFTMTNPNEFKTKEEIAGNLQESLLSPA